jgi:flagellar basal body-associated protein FliL
MKKFRDCSFLLLILLLSACPRPAKDVVLEWQATYDNKDRIKLLALAQFERETLVALASNAEEQASRNQLAKDSQKEILASLAKPDRALFLQELALLQNKSSTLDKLINPAQTAFYQDLPTIKGVTVEQPSHFFNIDLIIAYDANNRRLSNDISSFRLAIVDALRNLLMQYPASAFSQGREEFLREPMQEVINQVISRNGVDHRIDYLFITRLEIDEIPS